VGNFLIQEYRNTTVPTYFLLSLKAKNKMPLNILHIYIHVYITYIGHSLNKQEVYCMLGFGY